MHFGEAVSNRKRANQQSGSYVCAPERNNDRQSGYQPLQDKTNTRGGPQPPTTKPCYDMWGDDMSHVVTLCYLDEASARGFDRAFAPW